MLIVTWETHEFFKGSGIVFPFSVVLSYCCRSFGFESNTTIKIYKSHDVLLINVLHDVIEGNRLLGIMNTPCYKINFWAQNRMNYQLSRIKISVLEFSVFVQRFMQKEIFFFFDTGWALSSGRTYVLVKKFNSGWVRW